MNATGKEWMEKAEKDFATSRREIQVQEDQNYDAVCFHAQQCIEKLMKALLIHLGVVPRKTHDLAFLYQLIIPVFPNLSLPVEDLRFLTRAAVAFRYPGEAADQEDAQEAFDIAARLRERLLQLFKELQV
jgi:HEPN domain-containing protein